MAYVPLAKKGNTKIYETSVDRVTYATQIAVWNTNIVNIYTNKATGKIERLILHTGGYFSSLTKNRMNQASTEYNLGYVVYQKKHKWYCDYNGKTYQFRGNTLTFINGVCQESKQAPVENKAESPFTKDWQ